MSEQLKKFYTIDELSDLTGFSKKKLYREIARGNLKPRTRRGTIKPYYFFEEDVNDWINTSFVAVN